jgi:AraC-like DNA-binding protein
MRANFLDKFSINALAKNSGFKSEKKFYRVFKQLQRIIPAEYYDKIKNIKIS